MPDDDMTWWGRKCWADSRKELINELIVEVTEKIESGFEPHDWTPVLNWLMEKRGK